MTPLEYIFSLPVNDQVAAFRQKDYSAIPSWDKLKQEYLPENHPIMNRALYPDIVNDDGTLTPVTRFTYDLQRLATKRITELCYGIPVRREFQTMDSMQEEVANVFRAIFDRCRVDSLDIERGRQYFASCETFRLWYAVEERNRLYGVDSPIKMRCRNFSPMEGDTLYPIYDEFGDLVAFSIGYKRKSIYFENGKEVNYLDTYTATRHIRYRSNESGWDVEEDEDISNIGKIPGIYISRKTPIWEGASNIVYELEWADSRNGNYIRANSKPIFAVYADEEIRFGQEKAPEREFKGVFRFPKGSQAEYVTWQGAIESLKYFTQEARQMFFMQLQLPDLSWENMRNNVISGEAMKQMMVDAHLKVGDEQGPLLEAHDREVNVLRPFVRMIMGDGYADAIESLQVRCSIIPFTVNDETTTIQNYVNATGGKPIMSQRQAIGLLGKSNDVDRTLTEIQEESMSEYMEASI